MAQATNIAAPQAGERDANQSQGVTALGLVGFALALWASVTITRGARRIDRLIASYEASHGPLDLSGGAVVHGTPAITRLCDELVAAADYFYPFGWLVFVAAASSWCFFSLISFRARPRLLVASCLAAVSVLAVQLVLFAAPVHEMTIITE